MRVLWVDGMTVCGQEQVALWRYQGAWCMMQQVLASGDTVDMMLLMWHPMWQMLHCVDAPAAYVGKELSILRHKVSGCELDPVLTCDWLYECVSVRSTLGLGQHCCCHTIDIYDCCGPCCTQVGIYPEVKHPTWHNALPAVRAAGTTIEVLLLSVLSARGYTASFNTTAWRARPALIQCFEPSSLRLMSQHSQLPLVLLLGGWPGWVTPDTGQTHEQITSDASLRNLAEFVNGMGVWVESLFEAKAVDQGQQQQQQQQQQSSESTISPAIHSTHLVQRLHELGFLVHAYTLRDEQHFVPAVFGPQRTVSDEMQWLFGKEGIDGAFADYPGTLHAWLQKHGVHEGQAGSTLQPGP